MDDSEMTDFELGKTLAQKMGYTQLMKHPRCSQELVDGYCAGWKEGWGYINNEEEK